MAEQPDYNVEYWTQQEQLYLKQLKSEPDKAARNHMGLAMCYEIMHRYDECFHHCNKVLELAKTKTEIADAHVWMGRAFQSQKEINPAIAHYLQALDAEPEHSTAMEEMGNCYMELKDYENAEYWFYRLAGLEGDEEVGWLCLGNMFYETKDFDRSISYFDKCIEATPDYIEPWYGKGRALAGKELYTDAMEAFKEGADRAPTDALGQYYIGTCYQSMNDQYRAMHHYMKALEIDPGFVEALNNVGKLYHDFDGDIKTAIEYLEKALAQVEHGQLRQMLCINLCRLYTRIADTEKVDFYKQEIMKELGFGDLYSMGFDDEDFGEDDPEDDE